eukprot:TRINITY_DN9422_c0_g1_i1.p1 TRINITY_DN9422_c0_g1~~TRINITY_DN9422_c0_g1_i1.p1  ORF type:complete len:678 (+),score=161.98 TRINITY_DN9422_c0_g1_i1:78-2111(+)
MATDSERSVQKVEAVLGAAGRIGGLYLSCGGREVFECLKEGGFEAFKSKYHAVLGGVLKGLNCEQLHEIASDSSVVEYLGTQCGEGEQRAVQMLQHALAARYDDEELREWARVQLAEHVDNELVSSGIAPSLTRRIRAWLTDYLSNTEDEIQTGVQSYVTIVSGLLSKMNLDPSLPAMCRSCSIPCDNDAMFLLSAAATPPDTNRFSEVLTLHNPALLLSTLIDTNPAIGAGCKELFASCTPEESLLQEYHRLLSIEIGEKLKSSNIEGLEVARLMFATAGAADYKRLADKYYQELYREYAALDTAVDHGLRTHMETRQLAFYLIAGISERLFEALKQYYRQLSVVLKHARRSMEGYVRHVQQEMRSDVAASLHPDFSKDLREVVWELGGLERNVEEVLKRNRMQISQQNYEELTDQALLKVYSEFDSSVPCGHKPSLAAQIGGIAQPALTEVEGVDWERPFATLFLMPVLEVEFIIHREQAMVADRPTFLTLSKILKSPPKVHGVGTLVTFYHGVRTYEGVVTRAAGGQYEIEADDGRCFKGVRDMEIVRVEAYSRSVSPEHMRDLKEVMTFECSIKQVSTSVARDGDSALPLVPRSPESIAPNEQPLTPHRLPTPEPEPSVTSLKQHIADLSAENAVLRSNNKKLLAKYKLIKRKFQAAERSKRKRGKTSSQQSL